MKARVDRQEFADLLSWTVASLSAQRRIASVYGVRVEVAEGRLTARATDLQSTVEVWAPAQVGEPGVALIPHRLLTDLVGRLPGEAVTLQSAESDDHIELVSGDASFTLRCGPLDAFPDLPEPAADGHKLPGGFVARVARTVAPAAEPGAAKAVHRVSRLESDDGTLTVAATDSYRLATFDVGWDGPDLAVDLPADVWAGLAKVDGIPTMSADGSRVTFSYDDRRLTVQLVSCDYPDWRSLLPRDTSTDATVDASTLEAACQRALLLTLDNHANHATLLLFADGRLVVSAAVRERGQSDETVELESLDGPDLEIAFNARLLVDALSAVGDGPVVIGMREPLKPATFRAVDGDGYVHLVMTMRVD